MADKFKAWLQARHDQIMACEKEAISQMQAGDIQAYNTKMREKAEGLAVLAQDAEPELKRLPAAKAPSIRAALERFAQSAQMSLDLGSVWFMSALLYNDEHGANEPDNLQKLIAELPD